MDLGIGINVGPSRGCRVLGESGEASSASGGERQSTTSCDSGCAAQHVPPGDDALLMVWYHDPGHLSLRSQSIRKPYIRTAIHRSFQPENESSMCKHRAR